MIKKLKINWIVLITVALVSAATNAKTITYTQVNNDIFGSDGSRATIVGPNTFVRDRHGDRSTVTQVENNYFVKTHPRSNPYNANRLHPGIRNHSIAELQERSNRINLDDADW